MYKTIYSAGWDVSVCQENKYAFKCLENDATVSDQSQRTVGRVSDDCNDDWRLQSLCHQVPYLLSKGWVSADLRCYLVVTD